MPARPSAARRSVQGWCHLAKKDQDQVVEIPRLRPRITGENRRAKADRQQPFGIGRVPAQTTPVYCL